MPKTRGKLLGTRAYLCGPIDLCPDGGATWRKEITPMLNTLGVVVMDPLNKPFDTGLEADDDRTLRSYYKEAEYFDKLTTIMKEVRSVDLRMVDVSDFIVAYIDTKIYSCGTFEEIFLANRQKKPIILICKDGKKGVPDWLFATLPHEMFFPTVAGVMRYLKGINSGSDDRSFQRWLLPNFDRLYNHTVLSVMAEGHNGV